MPAEVKAEDGFEAEEATASLANDIDTSKAEANLKAKLSRKRTKTGCLTCRRRRIKCGEEQPVCKNCVKSKRQCEGYNNQRVVFRQPTLDYQLAPHGGAHITFQAGHMAAPAVPYHPTYQTVFDARVPAELRPRPNEPTPHTTQAPGPVPSFPPSQTTDYAERLAALQSSSAPRPDVNAFVPFGQHEYQQPNHDPYATGSFPMPEQYNPTGLQWNIPGYPDHPQPQTTPVDYGDIFTARPYLATGQRHELEAHTYPSTLTAHPSQTSDVGIVGLDYGIGQTQADDGLYDAHTATYTQQPELAQHFGDHASAGAEAPRTRRVYDNHLPEVLVTPEFYHHQPQLPVLSTPTQWLTQAAVEVQDDDYYDVQADEEMDGEIQEVPRHGQAQQAALHKILLSDMLSTQNLQIRRYDTFLYDGMLDHYRAEWTANPLKNPATARVFAHFVSATGPGMSIFERRPASSSMLFTGGSVTASQQSLWTYTLPMAALHHQGLLHAMLALSSLHIARLQGASATPSYQHYAWALKRVHASVGSKDPKKRLQLPVVAASMLLGFYEIITAEHSKWNTHLAGSKQLLLETDFAGMTRKLYKLKREHNARERRQGPMHSLPVHLRDQQSELLDQVLDVDERAVSRYVGREVRFDNPGHVEEVHAEIPPPLDVRNYETLRDLYWWYLKQDAIQSAISGNGLLLEYSRWPQCPPRAPVGRPDAVYGSYDHLILLLGRVADFASRDRFRKLKQMEAHGGQWRPAPEMKMPNPPKPPPGAAQARGPPPPTAGPAFYGMAPQPTKVHMPASYRPAGSSGEAHPAHISSSSHSPPDHHDSESYDLKKATAAALAEYAEIRAAIADFADALSGDAFQPLGPEYQPPLETSFGQALFYRSYDMGCLWGIYHMCVIIAIRSHPYQHPAAHAAAAIAAQETAFHANEIGRIAAGIVPGPASEPLNPTLGAALCESCLPSFFAAVQYQRADQRYETVMRIFGIALRTGWGTMELIANGCETAWVKAGEAGRGPPYKRCVRPERSDDLRLNGQWERVIRGDVTEQMEENDRRLVPTDANTRLTWAIGVMGVESDYARN